MKIFLDTSSLFKLYHREEGTSELEQVFSKAQVTTVFLSEISKIEFSSTIWKKVRTKEIAELDAQKTLSLVESDFGKYAFITIDSLLIEQANILISKYGKKGLRTLDSIQLSTAVSLFQKADIFFTADHQLQSFFLAEGLSIE
jgi:predicted nucleic acid-binding protein